MPMLRSSVGNRGVRILGPLFGVSHLDLCSRFVGTMTGLFEPLPVEMIQGVVNGLLEDDDAYASLCAVCNFLCTCRGAVAAATRSQRIELAARAFMGCDLAPLPHAPRRCAYTKLLYAFVRADVAHRSMMRMLADCATHCASRPCCHQGREDCNTMVTSDEWWRSWGCIGRALMQHAFGTERPAVRVAIASNKGAEPLCETDRGMVFAQHQSKKPRSLLRVEGQPSDVFSPDRELKVAAVAPVEPGESASLAASKGNLLAVLSHASLGWSEEEEEEGRARGWLRVWDMEANKCVYERRFYVVVQTMWMVGTKVYMFWQQREWGGGPEIWPVNIERCSPLGGPAAVFSLGNCGAIHDISLARHTGDLAIIDARPSQRTEHLLFFDVKLQQVRTLDSNRRTTTPQRSLVQFSPMGDTLVLVGKGHLHQATLIYRRSVSSALPRWQQTRLLGWQLAHTIAPTSERQFPLRVAYPYQHSVATPCGSKMVFFFKSGASGEVMSVLLRSQIEGAPWVKVDQVVHSTVPQDPVVWVDNGLYLPTGAEGGLLRVGS